MLGPKIQIVNSLAIHQRYGSLRNSHSGRSPRNARRANKATSFLYWVHSTYSFLALILFGFHQNLPEGVTPPPPAPAAGLFVCHQICFRLPRESLRISENSFSARNYFLVSPPKLSLAIIIIPLRYDESLNY